MMRIAILSDRIPPESRGGAGIVTWRLAYQLHNMGHDVHMISATGDAPFEAVREGIPTYHLHVRYPDRWRAWLSLYNPQVNSPLKALYKRVQPDVINAHNIHIDLTYHSLQLAHQMGIPTVFSSHDVMPFAYHKLSHFIDRTRCDVPVDAYRLPRFFNMRQMRFRYNPLRNLTIRRILRDHTQVRTAPSQALCDAHRANDLPPFVPVHNGIDVDTFAVEAEQVDALRERLGLHDRRVILFAGRLTKAKGTQQLLDALIQVVQQVQNITLLVLSSVPIVEQIGDVRYAHLRDQHIVAGGWLTGDELASAFHLADVTVTPSIIFDTFPTVNLEAMASRSVVLASCYGGSREAIEDGVSGYIINPFDTADFAEKLVRVLSDDAMRQRMAERAYQRVRALFTLAQQAQAMLAQYQQAIDTQ
ncbi:MAG: glycosyltransferase family 4 protein [Anaerolineae bacterium]